MDIDFDCQPHTSNKAISSIYSELLTSEEKLNLRPAYQRGLVWKENQKGNLVDSIMRRCPMPVFLLYSYEKDTPECIDGQNRLTSIKEYIEQTAGESVPWAWIRETDEHIECVYYTNPVTQEAMLKYCESKTKPVGKNTSKKPKVYRLMTPMEIKRFNAYQCTISEIQTKLTFNQRKDIFLRWQSGSPISQCDRFKNEGTPFCDFVTEEGYEKSLVPRISGFLKTGATNWLWDLFRLANVFYDGNTEPSSVFISTIKSRTKINSQTPESFDKEEMKNSMKRCEKFLGKFQFLTKLKNTMYISFILELAFLWNSSSPQICEVMEQEEFLLKFAEENLGDDDMNHNTLNNGPNETIVVQSYPRFKMLFMVAYDEQKPADAGNAKGKKEVIPAARKTEVWNHYIGETVGKAKCPCCDIRDITSRDFVAGHVISEHDGGTIDVENLRPICAICNSGMGSRNMIAWMKKMYPAIKLIAFIQHRS